MITTSIIYLGTYIANVILSIFPVSTGFPPEVSIAVTFIAGYVGILDPIVPIDTLLTVLTLVVTFELLIFAFKGFKWLFGHVPFVGGKG